MSARCRACGVEMIWAFTRDARRAPITRSPSDAGNVLVFRDERGVVQARTFAGFALDELRAQGVPLRMNHFADCPQAEEFAS
jgi:hypothetical protein